MTFQFEGDTITVATVVGPKTITVSFKLGEEYEVSPPPDDKPCVVSLLCIIKNKKEMISMFSDSRISLIYCFMSTLNS